MMDKELRYLTVSVDSVEIREKGDGEGFTFRGYAAVFNSWSGDLGGFREQIAPGAFTRAVSSGQDVRHLINHDPSLLLGRTASGTTRLTTDERGLRVETDLPDTTYARNLKALAARGDMTQMSFGFRTAEDGDSWNWEADLPERTLRDVDLFDVSSVTYPAYPETSGEVRALVEARGYTQAERDEMAKNGQALPDGSYPIKNADDLKAAIRLVGNGSAPKSEIKAHIIKRAEALGLTSLIPEGWRSADVETPEHRAAKVLSSANEERLRAGLDAVEQAGEHIGAVLTAATPDHAEGYSSAGSESKSVDHLDLYRRKLALLEMELPSEDAA